MSTKDQNFPELPVGKGFLVLLSGTHLSLYFVWGLVHAFLFGVQWWSVILTMYIMYLLSIGTHWAGHRPIFGWWYRAHMGHHIQDYPPSKFLSDGYTSAKQDNSTAYYPSMLICPFLVNCVRGEWGAVAWFTAFLPGAVMLYLANVLHMALHTRGHAWERFAWFQKLRTLHFYHHKGNMKHNYAVGDFVVDFLFFSLRSVW